MLKTYYTVFIVLITGLLYGVNAQLLFTASLNGSNEVPAVTTPATGTAWAVLSPDMKSLTYHVTYARLSGNFTVSHFHKAHPDSSGGVVQGITFSGNTASGTWTDLSADNLAALLKGYLYVNVHSSTNPGGEIRGQLTAVQGVGFTAQLDGMQEGGSVVTNARGTGWAVLKNKGSEIEYAFTFAGLTANPNASHIHNAPADSSGGVVHPITLSDSTASGTWTGFSDNMITELLKNRLYINVHTSTYPAGEIRGQLIHQGEIMFTASLDGAQENPDVTTDAKGTGWAVLTPTLSGLNYNITYARLSGNYSMSHFHNAPVDTNGGVIQAITFNGNNASGSWNNLSDANLQQLVKERMYVNVHSSTNPSGEIRGQLVLSNGIPFTAMLDGVQEGSSVVTSARGTGWFTYMPNALQYQFTFAGLSGNYTNAHFHNAPPGTPGGVVQAITVTDSTASGTWNNIPDNMLSELALGNLYINIHSSAYPSGEIRGQVRYSNYISGNIPVELTSFTASSAGSSVELSWSTASETNNAGFEIQRSADRGRNWERAGFITGKGTTTERSVYKFIDEPKGKSKLYYRLKQVDFNGSFEYSPLVEVALGQPGKFELAQNYPNPFNPATTINFNVPEKSTVTLKIFNILGKEVASLLNEVKEPGNYNIIFNAAGLSSGVYFYQLNAGSNMLIKKMTILK